ncbi:DUF1499 domain-containing protein [Afifella sp. IM 167]|uniref:DUF1499 domain-containing protein n=1 Tax=Afifella sp. IM 167 TaxID=2033586 RepID=UPI001CCFE8E8|nr:DUF1499 domain-containing protein [Afifella sp. IM 167]MBZ8133300.1 hypothetical protein [Afifella sp. IM 167]
MAARLPRHRSVSASWARRFGVLSLPVLVIAALGNRFGLLPIATVPPAIALGYALALVALAFAVFALVGIWSSGDEGAGQAFAGFFFSLPALILFAAAMTALVLYPQLNDISTDVEDPPRFFAFDHPLPPPEDAERQVEAYPGLTARFYPLSTDRVFAVAEALVKDRGWRIEESYTPVAGEGIGSIEAVARTLLFAFLDDVVIRVVPTTDGSIVDMRSASRIGEHDFGQNARRIKEFLTNLDGVLQGTIELQEPAVEEEEPDTFGPTPRPEPPSS